MAKETQINNRLSPHQWVSILFIFMFFSVCYLPTFDAVDRIGPQWLALNLINILNLLYFTIFYKRYWTMVKEWGTKLVPILWFAFMVWASLSYFWAINPIETLVCLGRQWNIYFLLIFFGVHLINLDGKFGWIPYFLVALLAIEVFYSLWSVKDALSGNERLNIEKLEGFAANPNVTAFSMVYKVPFLLYFIFFKKNWKMKLVSLLLLAIAAFTVLQLKSTGAQATFFIIIVITLFYIIYLFIKQKNTKKLIFTGLIFLLLGLGSWSFLNQKTTIVESIEGEKEERLVFEDTKNEISFLEIRIQNFRKESRLNYYGDALKQIKDTPLLGVGFGNWKIKSIYWERYSMSDFKLPYHVHNDILEFGAELGILGFALIAFIFIYTFLKLHNLSLDNILLFTLLLSLFIILMDINLNFPFWRPQNIIYIVFILALNNQFISNHKSLNR